MPFGIKAWDASGNVVLDLSQRITRILGVQALTTDTGSIVDPNLAIGSFWWDFPQSGASTRFDYVPAISLSGTTISWSNAGTSGGWMLRWGVY